MPGRDGSGPQGAGAQTGRGAGDCGANDRPGSVTVGSRGAGSRWRGRRNRFGSRGQGGRGQGGRGQGGRGRGNQSLAAAVTSSQPPVVDVQASNDSVVPDPALSATSTPRVPGELVALRQLTVTLTQSLEELQCRLAELEGREDGE